MWSCSSGATAGPGTVIGTDARAVRGDGVAQARKRGHAGTNRC